MKSSSNRERKKSRNITLLRQFSRYLLLLVASRFLSPSISQQTKEPIVVHSHIYTGSALCIYKDANTYYLGKKMPNKLISFYINPSDPEKILVLPDAGGTKKYQLVSRGTQCYTYPNAARYSAYGFYLQFVPDAQPENPGTDFTCKITKYILPSNMVPCNPAVTYMRFQNIYTFSSGTAALTYDNLIRGSVVNYSYDNFKLYLTFFVAMSSTLAPSSYFDDAFMEMLLGGPFRQGPQTYLAFYDMDRYHNLYVSFQHANVGSTLTSAKFLDRITHYSLPGWHFATNPALDNGKFANAFGVSDHHFSRTYCYNLYFGSPHNMNNNNIGVLKYKFDHRYPGMQLIRYNYHFHIKKVSTNINIEMRRVNFANDVTVLNTLSINIPFTKTDEFVHFGFCIGTNPLYYTTGTTFLIRTYEVLYGWHDNQKQIGHTHYDIQGGLGLLSSIGTGHGAAELTHFQYSNYNDRAMTSLNNANIFGLRLLNYIGMHASFPTVRMKKTGGANNNPDGRCMYDGIHKSWCNAYAFQRKRGSLSEIHSYHGIYHPRTDKNPVSKCLVAYDVQNCLVPAAGYNRDLVKKTDRYNAYPMHLISEFQGGSAAAVSLRQGRTKITDALGVEYWIKCPGGCK